MSLIPTLAVVILDPNADVARLQDEGYDPEEETRTCDWENQEEHDRINGRVQMLFGEQHRPIEDSTRQGKRDKRQESPDEGKQSERISLPWIVFVTRTHRLQIGVQSFAPKWKHIRMQAAGVGGRGA